MEFENYAVSEFCIEEALAMEPQLPDEITADEIERDRQLLISRFCCADHEITYNFVRLPKEVYKDPENRYEKYTALNLQYTLRRYTNGILVDRVVSERVVAVPGHIGARARQLRAEQNANAVTPSPGPVIV